MPELPDVEAYIQTLNKHLIDATLQRVIVSKDRASKIPREELLKCANTKITQIQRAGKEIQFVLDSGCTLSLHLMLSGQMFFVEKVTDVRDRQVAFETNRSDLPFLVVSDDRNLTCLKLDVAPSSVPDALTCTSLAEYLYRKFQETRSKNLKAMLLDQNVIRGLGNAYADEILFAAGISPKSVAKNIPREVVDVLAKSIPEVLRWAISEIRTKDPEILRGEYRDFFNVHTKLREMTRCGLPIRVEKIASKKTYFVDSQLKY